MTAAMVLIPYTAWASETEKHIWIPPVESVIPFALLPVFFIVSLLIKFV